MEPRNFRGDNPPVLDASLDTRRQTVRKRKKKRKAQLDSIASINDIPKKWQKSWPRSGSDSP